MFVKVAIDLSLDRLFTYSVPVELEKKLTVGQLLLVPFGHRTARGFAMEVCESNGFALAESVRIRDVVSIVDETPFFSSALLKLVSKIAAYTASPIESVLKAAIPAAVVKPGAKPKEQLFVEPCTALPKPEPKITTKQRWVFDQIVRLGGGWMSSICRELPTTPSMVRALSKLGLVIVEQRMKRRDPLSGGRTLPSKPLALNVEQQKALKLALADDSRPLLLHGITGSGKTEVYLQAIAAQLEAGRGAIVLVPEIALTPQTVRRFVSRFGERVAVLHSALSDGERYDEWHRIRRGSARVVVGPRSAVFAPVEKLGLIVVDEEHETSYKQDDSPRYHARDAAVLRASIEGAKTILGSATPSLESWMNAKRGKYAIATMTHRAGSGTTPSAAVVDMDVPENRGRIFSSQLLDAIKLRLERGEQTILFLNRRGWSRSVVCADCGHVLSCPNCSLPFTYHRADECCRCHVCGGWIPVPPSCPECKSPALTYKGIGTQRAEAALKKIFPNASVLRMDADSTSRKNSHDDILGAFRRHEADVLLGTQMIAKGLDFPNVTLVGVLNADNSLNMPDFRAAERTFQLIAQVAGRAGRAELPGEVIVQTYDPSSPIIRFASKSDFEAFAEEELRERELAFFPPFSHLAVINLRSKNPSLVADWADMYSKSLGKVKDIRVGEAVPSALEKADGWHRWQIVLRATGTGSIVRAWRWIARARPAPQGLRASIDVDAYNMS